MILGEAREAIRESVRSFAHTRLRPHSARLRHEHGFKGGVAATCIGGGEAMAVAVKRP